MNWVPPWISTLIDERSRPGELILRRKLSLAPAPLWREYSEVSQNWLSPRALNCPEGLPDWIPSLSVSPPPSLPGLPGINSISHLDSNPLSESASERADQSYIVAISTEQRKLSSTQCWSGDPIECCSPDHCRTTKNPRAESRTVKESVSLRQEGRAHIQKDTRSGKQRGWIFNEMEVALTLVPPSLVYRSDLPLAGCVVWISLSLPVTLWIKSDKCLTKHKISTSYT